MLFERRSRCVNAGHCSSNPASCSTFSLMSHFGSASVVIRHRAVIVASCLQTNCSFACCVPLSASSQKLLLKQTTAGRRILSTSSSTLFEVLLSMIVLPAAQVLRQSSEGMSSRAAAKASGAINGACCVVVVCLLLDVLFFSTLAIGEEHPMANVEENSSPSLLGIFRCDGTRFFSTNAAIL